MARKKVREDDGKGSGHANGMSTRERLGLTAGTRARTGLRSHGGLAPAGNRAALSNIGNMMDGAQGARQTRSAKARCVCDECEKTRERETDALASAESRERLTMIVVFVRTQSNDREGTSAGGDVERVRAESTASRHAMGTHGAAHEPRETERREPNRGVDDDGGRGCGHARVVFHLSRAKRGEWRCHDGCIAGYRSLRS